MATVSYNPFATVPIGQTGLAVTRLGFGGASIGGLYRAVADDDAVAAVGHAWDLGIRYFDVAPLYGYGNAERRMGRALSGRPRDEFVLSTKVGRLARIRATPCRPAPTSIVSRSTAGTTRSTSARRRSGWSSTYSYDGVMRSVEESLERLGLDRIDILYIHDPDDHWEAAIGGAYPALGGAAEPGGGQGHRRRHEPGRDARPLRARGRLRRVPGGRPLHPARPVGAARASPASPAPQDEEFS